MVIPLPEDIQAIRQEAIERFGTQEWERCVLTNLVHGHVGIYSILGVKMGLYAAELLGADDHSVSILSFAGSVPPMSCLNDGLQISTGSTLGRGLISISDEADNGPRAQFTSKGKTIRLGLRREYAQKIGEDITREREKYGNSPAYWLSVREAALAYWKGWDRKAIFELL